MVLRHNPPPLSPGDNGAKSYARQSEFRLDGFQQRMRHSREPPGHRTGNVDSCSRCFSSFSARDGLTRRLKTQPACDLCASRDIEAVTLIEDHGEADDIAPERLAKAVLTRWTRASPAPAAARRMGMALYNDVFRALGPMLSRPQ